MSNKQRLEYLLERYSEQTATPEELEELGARLGNSLDEQSATVWLLTQLQKSTPTENQAGDKQRLAYILKKIHQEREDYKDGQSSHKPNPAVQSALGPARQTPVRKLAWLKRWWPAVAAVLVLAAVGTYQRLTNWFNGRNHDAQITAASGLMSSAIQPGHNGAVLHLSNGKKILLDSLQNGTLASMGDVQLIKKNGMLQYIGVSDKLVYNTVTTNRGRQWQVTLSDGTKVWLNAESSIRYPLSFHGKERTVEITGEAFFEVVHNAQRPFKVLVKNQVIEDLGTTFNINAYKKRVATTLLTGSLRVHLGLRSATLKPGQQARVDNSIQLNYGVNTAAITAWKDGLFQFDNADLETIMGQVGQWYNVNIIYSDKPRSRVFSGIIPRDMSLADVLTILRQLGVHFKVRQHSGSSETAGEIIVSP